jgi:hypothetical protein
MENIVDHERDQLFGEMVGAIVIGTVGQDNGHVIRMVPGHHKMIGGSLGSRVWGTGVVRRFFGEESFGTQRSVYFICRYVVEQFVFEIVFPERAADMEQTGGAHYVGTDKGQGIHDGAVYMAFGCEVDNCVEPILFEEGLDPGFIDDVSFLEGVVGSVPDIFEISQITGIGQRIEIDDMILRVFFYE